MPTIRYQISNEFKLGNPFLYRASSKDEPEDLLEGVATAGLVGLLKQLGDLAEFASEILHDLHKEMMATVRRGHGLKLRIQQIEAECPSIEKSFLCPSNQTHFLYAAGVSWHAKLVSWHAKLHMGKNLIVRKGMPQFVADSYEECRGPPDLSALDKFDAAGDGACLRRYSDPSFFKLKLVKREKNVEDNKRAGPCWRHGENPGIVSAPRIDCKLQFMKSKVASKELPVTHVKLKSRVLYDSDTASHVEDLYHVLFPEENTASKSSKKPISEVHEISSDASSDIGTDPSQFPITEEATEHEVSTECSSYDNTSDDIASDVEKYVDALNTMESEVETEREYNVKPNVEFTTSRQGMNSRGNCTPKASPIKPVPTYGEEFSNCSIIDSTSSMHFSSNGVVKDSDVMLPCTSENSTVCSQTKNSAKRSDASSDVVTVENIYLEEYAEELDLEEMNVTTYDEQDEALPSASNLLERKSHEPTEQLTEAFPGDTHLQKSCITMQTRGLPEEMEIRSEPVDKLVYSGVELTPLKNTNFELLGDVKEPQESDKQDRNDLEIMEKSVPTDMAGITDGKLSYDFCCTIPNNKQKDRMDQYNIDRGPGSETSPCHHQDCEIEEIVLDEESLELQGGSIPNLISFEKYLSLQNGSYQSKPTDNMMKSDSTCEPDYQVTSSNVSFTEFLKLTQMDWLLNIEKKVDVDPLQNEDGHGSKSPVKRSHTPPDIELHQSNPFSLEYGNFEQSLPESIPATKNERPQHDQLTNPDNHTKDVKDDEEPRLVHRPRDPLIEEVASHDRSTAKAWIGKASRYRPSIWKVSEKHPGYNASDSDSGEVKDDKK